MKKVIMTLALVAGIAACFAQSDSVVRQYVLPSPRVTHEVRKEEPKTPSQALRELVSQPTEAPMLEISLTLDMLSTVLYNFGKNGSPFVRALMKESRDGLDVCVVTDKGSYRYNPEKNTLNLQAEGDFRSRFVGEHNEWSEAKCFLIAVVKSEKERTLSRELRKNSLEGMEDEGPEGKTETPARMRSQVSLETEPDQTPTNGKKENVKENQTLPTELNLPKHAVFMVARDYDFATK